MRAMKYATGREYADPERVWLVLHDSGTYVKFTQAGAELFA